MQSYTDHPIDVFISYGQTDNIEGWVTEFHQRLENRLRMLLGLGDKELVVWRDTQLQHIGSYQEDLRGRIRGSAVFLSVLTPRYVNSASCAEELRWFLEGNKGADIEPRLVHVCKTVLLGVKPAPFASSLGFEFFAVDPPQSGNHRDFGAQEGEWGFARFGDRLEEVAQALHHVLYRRRRKTQTNAAGTAVDGRKVVFLAPAARDLRSYRQSIASEMSGRGYTVVECDEPLPEDAPAFRQQVQGLLKASQISIHLAGARYGAVPDEEMKSYAEIAHELAADVRSQREFRQLTWVPENVENVDPRQQTFLEKLRGPADCGNAARCELLQTSFESFKEGVFDFLSRKAKAPSGGIAVYLACDQSDLSDENLEKIKNHLMGRGHPVELPAFQGGELTVDTLEEELIAETGAALIYYGKAQDHWVKRKRLRIRKILTNGPASREYTRALYLDRPEDSLKARNYLNIAGRRYPEPGVPPLLLLGDCGEFRPEHLEPFLQALRG